VRQVYCMEQRAYKITPTTQPVVRGEINERFVSVCGGTIKYMPT
jgi:hypothetical protein